MTDKVVYLDAGHGGLAPGNGTYTTHPDKQFRHGNQSFHRFGWFYEGVWNRDMLVRVFKRLRALSIRTIIVSHAWQDTPLAQRTERANWYHKNWRPGILVSLHANASPTHNARGYEVYTSPGPTSADLLAELHWQATRDLLGNRIRMRDDISDGDHDKEAQFWMLQKTVMPAILVEHLFFDQHEDAQLLMDETILDLFAEATVRAIVEYYGTSV